MQRIIGFEDEVHTHVAFDLLENRIVRVVYGTVHDGIEADDDVLSLVQVVQFHQLAPDLERNCRIRFDPSAAAAIRTRLRQRTLETLPNALAGHLDQTELRDLQDLRLGTILPNLDLQRFEQPLAIGEILHVDEVEDDDPAEVAQANLANDFSGRFEVRLEH